MMMKQILRNHSIALDKIIPDHSSKPYDMKKVIHHVMDPGSFWEIKPDFTQ